MASIIAFLVTGAFAGFLAGLFGVGGGLIMVPALVFLLSLHGVGSEVLTHIAIGTSLAVVAMTSVSSTLAHHRHGGVSWSIIRFLAPGLAVGALIGAAAADHFSGATLQRMVGIGALLIAAQIALKRQPAIEASPQRAHPAELFGVGGIIGALSSLIGIGGGSLTVPYLTLRGNDIRVAVGTAAAGGVPIAWAGALGFMLTGLGESGLPSGTVGYVHLGGFVGLAVTSTLCAPLGARLAHRLPKLLLKRAFATLLCIVGIKMLWG